MYPEADPWRADDWRRIEEWKWAVDLFNHEYWWESHEALESLWHAAGRTTGPARFVQALVHLSAACLNRRRGHHVAARRQAARSVQGLRAARAHGTTPAGGAGPLFMGIDIDRLIGDIERSFATDSAPAVLIELDFEEV